MTEAIFLVDKNGELIRLTKSDYDSESILQELLAKYPDLLPGDQIDATVPRKWLFIAREVGIPGEEEGANRWSLDHLFIDQYGIPTLIEVKRSTDTRIRREVVGQMLDYAANVVSYWPIETVIAKFESACEVDGRDSEQVLGDFLGNAAAADFWEQTRTNLRAGKIRMVFVADEIPSELKTVVEFLNAQMNPAEVLAIEVPQFQGQGLKTLVPRVYGRTSQSEARRTPAGGRSQWNPERLFTELAARTSQQCVDVAKDILDWIGPEVSRIWWGRGMSDGSFIPVLTHKGLDYQLFAARSLGTVEIPFQWHARKPLYDSQATRMEMLRRLNEIPGVTLSVESIDRRPKIPMDLLAESGARESFKSAFEWYIAEIKKL